MMKHTVYRPLLSATSQKICEAFAHFVVLIAALSRFFQKNNNKVITFLDSDWAKPLSINIPSYWNVNVQLH